MRPRTKKREPLPIAVPTGRITAITPSPRPAGRFDLSIDGELAGRLSIEGIERLGVHVGQTIGEPRALEIAAEAELTRSYDRALAILATRGRAAGELRRLLVQKGESAGVADQVIRRLQRAGFLDDAVFARQFTRWKATTAGLSRRRIERELTRRGIDRETAASAIEATFAEEGVDEKAALENAAERKLRTLVKVDVQTKRRRLFGFLARRGYDADDIGPVINRLTAAPAGE